MTQPAIDWPWQPSDFSEPVTQSSALSADDLAAVAARCFRGNDGDQFLAYLRGLTSDRALGPDASDAVLRHVEGQRQLVQHIHRLAAAGRQGQHQAATLKQRNGDA